MKKFSIALVVACLMALTAGTVSADVYDFEDEIDYGYPGQLITQQSAHVYFHNINPYVDFAAGDEVVEAELTLVFNDVERERYWSNGWKYRWVEEGDDTYGGWYGWGAYDNEEWVALQFDGGAWNYLGEVDTGTETLEVAMALLNTDGILNVTVAVYNDLCTADIYLQSSTLSGTAQVVPVPGAVLLGVLGLGAAGMKLRRRNAA